MQEPIDIDEDAETQAVNVGQNGQNFTYTVPTENRYVSLADQEYTGYQDNSSVTDAQNNPSKRKRFNTGGVENFDDMGTDDKLNLIFAKLLNIETTQDEIRTVQASANRTAGRLQRTVRHVDNNTYKLQQLSYKYLDLETKSRQRNVIVYGIEERDENSIIAVVRDFLRNQLQIEDEDEIYVEYACRLGDLANNRNRGVPRRPILCTFGHHSEVDIVMKQARRLKNTHYSIDRDYPLEISAARKKLWPEVKELRRTPNSNE